MNLLNDLNEAQKDVVLNGDGPCLVLAGAGSGKTRVITYRTAYLLSQGILPENILIMTFTNKAAREMTERITKITGLDKSLPYAGTFHHIAYKLLKKYAESVGYQNNFSILDQEDSLSLFKICVKENVVSGAEKNFPAPRVIREIWSFTRNSMKPLKETIEIKGERWLSVLSDIERVINSYEKKKRQANSMDFDDLLVNFLALLSFDDVRVRLARQFQYVLVDEYQDTNRLQAKIIKKLASYHNNVLAVGDDAQSIYSFRAADIKNILGFDDDFPGAKIFKLETNYRSSQEILSLANAVIDNNKRQYKKRLNTTFNTDIKPEFKASFNPKAEAGFVFKKIKKLLDNGVNPKEIAVLFRAAHHSQPLEVELVRGGVDYDYRGGVRFFERAHVKDVLSYLKILNNLSDEAAWRRVLLKEEGIGPVGVEKVLSAIRDVTHNVIPTEAQSEGQAKWRDPHDLSETKDRVYEIGFSVLPGKGQIGWRNFLRVWEAITPDPRLASNILIKKILHSGYEEYLENEYMDSRERKQDINQLIELAKSKNDLSEFLAETTLAENYRVAEAEGLQKKNEPRIVLSTIHQAKGLEWENVFIINLSASGFPNERALGEADGLEEERRLFYVAITRAKKQLTLTYPSESGGWGDSANGPSMFLEEIDPDLLAEPPSYLSSLSDLNDDSEEISYIPEEKRFKPGSFLRDIEDL